MANALQASAREAFLGNSMAGGWDDLDFRVILIDTAQYTYSSAHDFLNDVASGARVAVSAALTGKSITNGVADAADTTVTIGASKPSIEALLIYQHTGTDSTSRIICYIDTVTSGLPFTPPSGGGDVVIVWPSAGIFTLSR